MGKFCMGCGKPLQPADKFCMACGREVTEIGAMPHAVEAVSNATSPSGMPVSPADKHSDLFAVSGQLHVPAAVSSGGPVDAGASSMGKLSPESVPSPLSSTDGQPAWVSPDAGAPWAQQAVDSAEDIAPTEVWQVDVSKTPSHAAPFVMQVPKDELKPSRGKPSFPWQDEGQRVSKPASSDGFADAVAPKPASMLSGGSEFGADALADLRHDDDDESPTIVAQFLEAEEDDVDSPTIVVVKEHGVLTRQEGGERIEFVPPCIVGRGKASDKRFKGNQAISRKHVKFVKREGQYFIEDLGSTNGTCVNGVELQAEVPVPVADGAVVRLGTEDFVFSVEGD